MREQHLDALLFTTEPEIRYFTGFRTLFWQSPTRPWFLIVPSAGKPIAVIPEIGAHLMACTWLDDIRTWASPHASDDGVSLLSQALSHAGRIGIPMGRESSLRMPLNDFQRLQDSLTTSEFGDATALVQQLRMVKSEAEIAKHAAACTIASRAFAAASGLFFEGQALNEAFRSFKIELLKQGAEDVPYLVGGAGPGGYDDVISPPDSQPLVRGDVLMLDTGATLQGYYCDFDRNFAIGDANDTAKKTYRTLYEATEAGLAAARPGARCADVYHAMAKVIDAAGGKVSGVGRFGHGLGMQLTEAPSLISFDDTVLKENMVITLEPSMGMGIATNVNVDTGNGIQKIMVHEENIVVRDGAPQLLSERAPESLPVL
jgi:Xaa-Pro aminopeptidase